MQPNSFAKTADDPVAAGQHVAGGQGRPDGPRPRSRILPARVLSRTGPPPPPYSPATSAGTAARPLGSRRDSSTTRKSFNTGRSRRSTRLGARRVREGIYGRQRPAEMPVPRLRVYLTTGLAEPVGVVLDLECQSLDLIVPGALGTRHWAGFRRAMQARRSRTRQLNIPVVCAKRRASGADFQPPADPQWTGSAVPSERSESSPRGTGIRAFRMTVEPASAASPAAATRTACTNSADGVHELGGWKVQDRFLIPGTERRPAPVSAEPELGTVLTPNGGSRAVWWSRTVPLIRLAQVGQADAQLRVFLPGCSGDVGGDDIGRVPV